LDNTELARQVIESAMKAGASAAEVLVQEGTEFSASVRLREVERLRQASSHRLGMRIFSGTRAAVFATSDFSSRTLERAVRETLTMAGAAGEDPAAGLPDPELYAAKLPSMNLAFPAAAGLSVDEKIGLAHQCEEAALNFDPRINNSEGATFADSLTHITYGNSLNHVSAYSKSVCSLSVTPLAESDGMKQRDYWLSTSLDAAKLESPEEVGKQAARRALRRLGARKVRTCEVPVVFEPLAAASLLRHVSDAVSGTALLRKASFLVDKLGSRAASPLVTIYDDALMPGGLGSRPFDAEGVPSQRTTVIREGILEGYLLDAYSARKLGLRSTGNSDRELNGGPSVGPSNFYVKPGESTPGEIVSSIRNGLYVTELIGFGVNVVSGDYSQGAAGLWIENGTPAFPVEEITIAGNLKDMLTRIEGVGNDLLVLGEIFSPTLLIGRMVVSGN
jgi:PmbA protein